MNIARVKGLTWLASLLVGGLLVTAAYRFLRDKAGLMGYVSESTLERVLDGVEEPEPLTDDTVSYATVLGVFQGWDWTGAEESVVDGGELEGSDADAPEPSVSELLWVLVVQVDPQDAAGSSAYVHFSDARLLHWNDAEHEDRLLRVGERLYAPFEYVEVEAITREGVTFVFPDDPERASELVPVKEFDLGRRPGIVVVGHVVEPQEPRQGFAGPAPLGTARTRGSVFRVSSEDARELDRDFSRILSEDVRLRTHRGPDGRVDGVQVTHVEPGSLPSRFGLTGGEIIKSINGHPVKSVNEAVALVKQLAETTDTWVVVFEKQGKTHTRTYHSPDE